MDVISIETGRATWLLPIEEIVPLGGLDGMAVIAAIAERYEFKSFPQNPVREEIDKNGMKFSTGVFKSDGKRAGIGEFALYNDGFVAVSNTTEHSGAFLEDLFGFVVKEFQFRRPISPIKKIYVSIVTVEFGYAVANMLAKHTALLSLIGSYLNAPKKTSHEVAVTRLDFALDDESTANTRPKLILESRLTVPLTRKRYYSNAAMHTKDHLELLKRIEEQFMNPSTADS